VIKKMLLLSLVGIALMLTASCIIYVPYPEEYPPPQEQDYYDRDYRDYSGRYDTSYFYDYLSPHGLWVYQPPYGYVWIPKVYRYGWRPYSYGSWVWTDYGWTWISDWEWGWIPFHYGRWEWDDYLGWFWVPDTVWGPAWVSWRRSHLYIGWAPLPPDARFIPGVGIRGVTSLFPDRCWVFVDYPHFYRTHIYRNMLPLERNRTIITTTIHKTNIVMRNQLIFNEGVEMDYIERRVDGPIVKHSLQDADRPTRTVVSDDELQVFRPNIEKNETARPKTVIRREDVGGEISRSRTGQAGDVSPGQVETTLEENQTREITILRRTQEQEIEDIQKKSEEKKKTVGSVTSKKKIDQEAQGQIGQLKSKHAAEEAELKKRHEAEKSKVKVGKVKKKK
jgi:hypothetical protein